jgi:hypothetical protein
LRDACNAILQLTHLCVRDERDGWLVGRRQTEEMKKEGGIVMDRGLDIPI